MSFLSSLLCLGLGRKTHCAKCSGKNTGCQILSNGSSSFSNTSVLYQSYESTEPEKVKAILLGLEKVNRKDPGENKSESELKDF